MDINLHLIPHIHRKKNQNTQEQENTMSEPITINVNDKIEAGKRAIVEAAVNNPDWHFWLYLLPERQGEVSHGYHEARCHYAE